MGDVCNVVFEEGFEWQEKGKNWGNWEAPALLGCPRRAYCAPSGADMYTEQSQYVHRAEPICAPSGSAKLDEQYVHRAEPR